MCNLPPNFQKTEALRKLRNALLLESLNAPVKTLAELEASQVAQLQTVELQQQTEKLKSSK